jgi:hypothetical protein
MRTLNTSTDLFDPRTVMESDFSSGVSAADADFAFAFNDSNFSDRMLRIEILGDPPENMPDSEACISIADWARHRKRRREDIKKENGKILWFLFLWFCLVADKIWEYSRKTAFLSFILVFMRGNWKLSLVASQVASMKPCLVSKLLISYVSGWVRKRLETEVLDAIELKDFHLISI